MTFVVMVVSLLLLGACSGTGAEPDRAAGSDPEQTAARAGSRIPPRRDVRLALTDWTGSRINVAIAEMLIERRLGYPVTLVEPSGDLNDMLLSVERGELDAVLELWPSALSTDEQAMIDQGRVESLGPLGVTGQVGWYVPAHVVEADPSLGTWEGYRSQSVATSFATEETAPAGRLLGTDPSYEQQDEELVEALDLPFQVVYSGSEDETRLELRRAIVAGEPILLYWWSPTAEVARYDLVKVDLPPRTDECLESRADGALMSCDYPTDELMKVGAPGLADSDPELHHFLQSFAMETEEQAGLIARAEIDGEPIADIAAAWIEENRRVWESWIES